MQGVVMPKSTVFPVKIALGKRKDEQGMRREVMEMTLITGLLPVR